VSAKLLKCKNVEELMVGFRLARQLALFLMGLHVRLLTVGWEWECSDIELNEEVLGLTCQLRNASAYFLNIYICMYVCLPRDFPFKRICWHQYLNGMTSV
jgi:hypothetical protein